MTETNASAPQGAQTTPSAVAEQSAAMFAKALNAQGNVAVTSMHAMQAWQARMLELVRQSVEMQLGFSQKLAAMRSPTDFTQLMNDQLRDWSNLLGDHMKEASKLGQEISRAAMSQSGSATDAPKS